MRMTSSCRVPDGQADPTGLPHQFRYLTSAIRYPNGGGERDRTDDLLLAKQALSQLSYTPLAGIRSQGSEQRLQGSRLDIQPMAPMPAVLIPDY
jgi:hypothetical protein